MAVIEMIMLLYTREVVTPDRILSAVQRFDHGKTSVPNMSDNIVDQLLVWVNHACDALRIRIEQEIGSGVTNGGDVSTAV